MKIEIRPPIQAQPHLLQIAIPDGSMQLLIEEGTLRARDYIGR